MVIRKKDHSNNTGEKEKKGARMKRPYVSQPQSKLHLLAYPEIAVCGTRIVGDVELVYNPLNHVICSVCEKARKDEIKK